MSCVIISDSLENRKNFLETSFKKTANLRRHESIFPDHPQFKKVFQFIEENYYKPIALVDVAQAVGYSPAYLTSLVKSQTKRTIFSWVVERRMLEARYLLLDTNQSVTQIATAVGYPDSCYFSRRFRQIHKISPQEWRNGHRTKESVQ
ncbi:hypothetical protein NUACC21_22350 [Scytonema sp. NUACC21]